MRGAPNPRIVRHEATRVALTFGAYMVDPEEASGVLYLKHHPFSAVPWQCQGSTGNALPTDKLKVKG